MSGLAGLRAQNAPDMDSLMARTFSYVLRNGLRNDGFSSEVYVQHHLYTRRRGVLMRYLPGGLRLEKGKNEYFGESLSKYQFMPPAQIDRKDLAAFSTMPYVEQPRDQWLGNYSMSIYEPNLFSNGLLSPFNAINRRYYRYKYIYSYDDPERRVACVHVEPRIWNSQLVRGTADIDEATGAVRRFSFDFYYGWAHLHVTGTLGKDGRSSLLPEKISLDSDMKVLGNVLVDRFDAVVKYDFNRPEEQTADDSLKQRNRFDLTEQCRLHVDTTSVRRDLAFFEEHRPVALTKEQRDIYEQAASAKRTTTDSLKNASFQPLYQTAENIFLDSHSLQLGDHGTLRLPPLLTPSMVEWSRGDGISLRTRLSFDFPLSQKSRLQFRPQVGYNFRQKRVYWECPLQLRFLPKYDGCLSIQAAGGEYIYNSKQADEVREKLEGITHYDSLLQVFNRYDFQSPFIPIFRNTWKHGNFPKNMVISWHQDGIFYARMGMVREAYEYNLKKLGNSPRRFPTFWGPGHDWVPDHNWGGSGMIGLQEMLLQTVGQKIYILPCWPADKDVRFKLHAPDKTVVEVEFAAGKVRKLSVTPRSRRKDIVLCL